MSKLLRIVKKRISYKQCITDIRTALNDITKDNLEIRIDKIPFIDEFKVRVNLNISYFKKEVSGD